MIYFPLSILFSILSVSSVPFTPSLLHSSTHPFLISCVQRKSNRAKEKKARRLEERAAMDAVCAKVDAANKVILVKELSVALAVGNMEAFRGGGIEIFKALVWDICVVWN